jgi:hypothetical protein
MKRTSKKNQREQALERRLQLVRTTIRQLTPAQLARVNGGNNGDVAEPDPLPTCIPFITCIDWP